MADLATGSKRAPLSERGHDLYETPPVAVHALTRVENLPPVIWEPACGPGAIVRALRGAGHTVIAQDLIDYGCPDSRAGIDFLRETAAPAGAEVIVTNPPYSLCERRAPFVPRRWIWRRKSACCCAQGSSPQAAGSTSSTVASWLASTLSWIGCR